MKTFLNFTRKSDKHYSPSKINTMTPLEIINISPSKVSSSIDTSSLPEDKRNALKKLLAIKRTEKTMTSQSHKLKFRSHAIGEYVSSLEKHNSGKPSEVDNLMVDTHSEIMADNVRKKRLRNLGVTNSYNGGSNKRTANKRNNKTNKTLHLKSRYSITKK